jgi:hypothetical protein
MTLRVLLAIVLAAPLAADEGMWPFNLFPKDSVKQKYSAEITDAFLEHLRLASVTIGGGSGAFVSPNGLILTTRKAAASCLAAAAQDAFYAATSDSEIPCPGLAASALIAIEPQGKNTTADNEIPVRLYAGARNDVYRYQRYTDVRLVFAPESAIANFGGTADALTYPRYDLDVAFLRAYEDGKPAATAHYLKWSAEGVTENGLVFATGSPQPTSRLATQAQFNFFRTVQLPLALARLGMRIELLRAYSTQNEENRRAAQATLAELATAYKTAAGELIGLKDERLTLRKQQFEKRLRRAVENDPKLGTEAGKVWDEVAAGYRTWAPNEKAYELLESHAAEGSVLFRDARAQLRGKPASAPAPVNEGMEIGLLTQYLEELKALGDKEAPVKAILQGRTPQAAAEAYVRGGKVKDLAQIIEGPALKMKKKYEESVGALQTKALNRIAQYRFKVLPGEYPDATGTVRVVFGTVKAYRDKTEAPAPYTTTYGGLFHRAGKEDPYVLPRRASAALDCRCQDVDPDSPVQFREHVRSAGRKLRQSHRERKRRIGGHGL